MPLIIGLIGSSVVSWLVHGYVVKKAAENDDGAAKGGTSFLVVGLVMFAAYWAYMKARRW